MFLLFRCFAINRSFYGQACEPYWRRSESVVFNLVVATFEGSQVDNLLYVHSCVIFCFIRVLSKGCWVI